MKNQRPQPFLFKNLKWFASALVIPGLLFVYFIPRTVQYSDYSVVRWSPFFIIVFIALLILIALILFTKQYKISLLLAMGSFVIIGPTFESFQDYREKKELDKYGVWTKSIVVDKKPGRKGFGWLIRCKYEAKGQVYQTLYHDDVENVHPVGDTIRLIYSSQFPKIYALEYEWKK